MRLSKVALLDPPLWSSVACTGCLIHAIWRPKWAVSPYLSRYYPCPVSLLPPVTEQNRKINRLFFPSRDLSI